LHRYFELELSRAFLSIEFIRSGLYITTPTSTLILQGKEDERSFETQHAGPLVATITGSGSVYYLLVCSHNDATGTLCEQLHIRIGPSLAIAQWPACGSSLSCFPCPHNRPTVLASHLSVVDAKGAEWHIACRSLQDCDALTRCLAATKAHVAIYRLAIHAHLHPHTHIYTHKRTLTPTHTYILTAVTSLRPPP
jgi:hypothetical protein